MTGFTFSIVDEGGGYKDSRRFALDDADMARIVWAYDKCFHCDGDPKAVFDVIAARLIAVLVDHAHSYEMAQPRIPIVPKQE